MKALLVFAHPESESFSAALKNVAVDTLKSEGYEVEVSDLYRMAWNPVLAPHEFTVRDDEDYFEAMAEQLAAFTRGAQSRDVAAEQAKVAEADLMILHFPMWWFSMPAILKGWFDRVFGNGFAYGGGRKYSDGHLVGKRAMVVVTTGTGATSFAPNGVDGSLHHVLWPIQNGMLAYSGYSVLPPFAAWSPAGLTARERDEYLEAFAQRLRAIESTEPLFIHPLDDYDSSMRLKPGVIARSGVQWNPAAGQSHETAAAAYAP